MHLMVQPRGPLIEVNVNENQKLDINVYNQQPTLIAQAMDLEPAAFVAWVQENVIPFAPQE